MAVRSALGATRGRLVRQLLAESSVLAMAACVVGCLFAWFGMKFVPAIIPRTGDIYGGGHLGGETGLGLNAACFIFCFGPYCPHDADLRFGPGSSCSAHGHTTATGRHGQRRKRRLPPRKVSSRASDRRSSSLHRSFDWRRIDDAQLFPSHARRPGLQSQECSCSSFSCLRLSHNKIPAPLTRFASPQGQVILQNVAERLKSLPGVAHVSIEDAIPGYSPSLDPK